MPLFSVIVPVHNRAHLIRDCVDSVLGQTFRDFELIIVDNNSTDDLGSVIATYHDTRIHFTHCSTPGPSAARNHGAAVSKGRILSFMDSDDIWREDVLEVVRQSFEEHPQLKAVFLSSLPFRKPEALDWQGAARGSRIVVDDFLQALVTGVPGAGGLAGVLRELVEGGEGFSEELWVGEDVDWACRHAAVGPVMVLRDAPRLGYRRHDENITKDRVRYVTWARQLVEFATQGRYRTGDNPPLRRFIVSHLLGQMNSILFLRGYASFLSLYPKVARLALRWGMWRPLLMLDLWSAYFGKRFRRLASSKTSS